MYRVVLTMPNPMMVRLPDLVDMQPQKVFMTDIVTGSFFHPPEQNSAVD